MFGGVWSATRRLDRVSGAVADHHFIVESSPRIQQSPLQWSGKMEDFSQNIWSNAFSRLDDTEMALCPPVRLSRTALPAHNQGIPPVDNDCLANASGIGEGGPMKHMVPCSPHLHQYEFKGQLVCIRVLIMSRYRRKLLNFRVSRCMSSYSLRGQHFH